MKCVLLILLFSVANCTIVNFVQNLIPTHVLDVAENSLCHKHSERYRNGLNNLENWALTMLDSSAKLQSGILSGNYVGFGNFEQCLGVSFEDIKGKHCFLKITPSIDTIRGLLTVQNISQKRFDLIEPYLERYFHWSICVPESCSSEQVLTHAKKTLPDFASNITLDEQHCVSAANKKSFGTMEYLVVIVILVFIGTSIVGTIFESQSPVFAAFSIKRNYQSLVAENENEIKCFYGLRSLTSIWVVIIHVVCVMIRVPQSNNVAFMNGTGKYIIPFANGLTLPVDTFFILSALLTSNKFLQEISKTKSINIWRFYLQRYFRLTAVFSFVVLVYSSNLIQILGSGPKWYDIHSRYIQSCQKYWWSALLHVQTYVNPNMMCVDQSWSVTCEMMFCLVAPLILYPLWKNRTIGLLFWGLIFTSSISISFYLASLNEYRVGMGNPAANFLDEEYFQYYYITPHTRIPTYLLGLILGYYQYHCGRNQKINFYWNIFGWFCAYLALFLSVVLSYRDNMNDYNELKDPLYLSLSRSVWGLGIIWIIWACINDNGGIINKFLSLPIFKIVGRLSYGIYLIHIALQLLNKSTIKVPQDISVLSLFYSLSGNVLISCGLSFIIYIFYEQPILNLSRLLFKSKKLHQN